jgi:SAM-dependent methyltransferase/8-oxo-dGTP pyrophosphatase MutT (NUDIX family)
MSDVWADIHKTKYAASDWIDKSSIFAGTAITYFPKTGKILELGAGQGQDSRFFAENGYEVTSTDLEQGALGLSEEKTSKELQSLISLRQLNLQDELPFENESFDVIYAHLSLHYFDNETTDRLFDEVYRVLRRGGTFAFLVNSTSDPEYGQGRQLEPDYFQIGKLAKRYLSVKTARTLTQYFDTTLLDNQGETYKDAAKDIHNLVRYIGTKPVEDKFGGIAIPCAGAIIEQEVDGEVEVLIQTRWQPGFDTIYSGTLEFPIGRLDVPYENIFDTVAREIKEEAGLVLHAIRGEDKTAVLTSGKDDEIIGFRPFCCIQQLKNGRPWVGFIFLCSVEPGEPKSQLSETRDVRWIKAVELRKLFESSPEKFFGLQLPAWQYYFQEER